MDASKPLRIYHPEQPYKLFQVILAAIVKAVTLRPKLNRFIQGNRTYQRNVLTVAFVVKKQFADEAHEALAFLSFDESANIDSIHTKILEEIQVCRSEQLDNSTAGMDALTKLPRFLLRFIMWILRRLDYYGRVTIGECRKRPVYFEDGTFEIRSTVDIGLTIDERIADGYYYSGTMRLLKHLLQNPELLELPAGEPIEMLKV